MEHRITIIRMRKPISNEINEELQWLGSSLGLFSLRDKDKSCFRIFIELMKNSKTQTPTISSDELAYKLNLTRGTVVHHINKLIEAGIVIKEGNKGYMLRSNSLKELVEEVEKDIKRTYDDLKNMATKIDMKLNH